jgi:hypothetical protein
MSDQNDEKEKSSRIVIPIAPAADQSTILLTETFEVRASPTIDEVIRTMARLANFLNLYAAEALRARIVTAANPATPSLMSAAQNLEQGAMAQRQELAMRAQGQFVGPGGGPGPGGMPGAGPFRMN